MRAVPWCFPFILGLVFVGMCCNYRFCHRLYDMASKRAPEQGVRKQMQNEVTAARTELKAALQEDGTGGLARERDSGAAGKDEEGVNAQA